MSEKCLPEKSYEEYPGFRSALFLNISEYHPNSLTPKRDIRDSVETSRLSIESLTPGTTPKGTEKRNSDSNFKFCLSKDLLKRLEESSPLNVYTEKMAKFSDIFLNGCDVTEEEKFEDEEFDFETIRRPNQNFKKILDFTPSTFDQSYSLTNSHACKHKSKFENFEENNYQDEVARKLNFSKESENNFNYNVNLQNQFSNHMSSGSSSLNILNNNIASNSFGKGLGNSYNVNQINQINQMNQHLFMSHSNNKNQFNKFTQMSFNFNQDGNTNLGKNFNLQNLNNIQNNCNNNNSSINTNMYGKNGWICQFCKNFNYEIRVKCNRCTKCRTDLEKSAIVINHNINNYKQESPNSSDSNGSSQKKKKPFVERAGDWNCFKCKNLNFSFRVNCNRCQLSKKESEKSNEQQMKNILSLNSLPNNNNSSLPDLSDELNYAQGISSIGS